MLAVQWRANLLGLELMLAQIRIQGGKPAGLLIRDRHDWRALFGEDAPFEHEGLPIVTSPWAPPLEVFAVNADIMKQAQAHPPRIT